jgi:hypothetical protein
MMPGFATHSGGDIILNNSEDDNSYFKSLEKCLQRLKSDIYD